AALSLIAATPQQALSGLEANGYYIEDGAAATEAVVSDAVFEGRADGGRLYIVVLAEEPPGGAPTFSDSVLDLLGEGYVVTVAPESVGFAGDGSHWSADTMNAAIDFSLSGGSDDDVVARFIESLTGRSVSGGDTSGGAASSGGGIPILWVLVIGGALVAFWYFASRNQREKRTVERLGEVRELARSKLDEVANDILEMEDEISVSDDSEAKEHYQRASRMYAQAMEDVQAASTIPAMLEVSEELDLAIWELDCAEAILDGKPKPAKPDPPRPESLQRTPPAEDPNEDPAPGRRPIDDFARRSQRQSSGSNEVLNMLLAMMAMGGMRGGGGFGGGIGGFRGGSDRSSGGGRRSMGGGGRIRGGGRRG
ncbi:MAG TPA: hypothetical protein VK969_05615, partial [Acidimicrobiia bacterium]|nr:hypothetical protein [Acidimicrobiia bacterium]